MPNSINLISIPHKAMKKKPGKEGSKAGKAVKGHINELMILKSIGWMYQTAGC